MQAIDKPYDVTIVGSGFAGASLALALRDSALRIALIDATPLSTKEDKRLIALTYPNYQFLTSLQLQNELSPHAAAIQQVHVSHRGRFGISRIHAQELQLPALGYVIPAKYIGQALLNELTHVHQVDIFRPATVTHLQTESDTTTLTLNSEKILKTKLLVGADGTFSTVRKLLNIAHHTVDYQQTAIVTEVTLKRSHQGIAYERFLTQGTIALLPLLGNHAALIWTLPEEEAKRLLALSDAAFLAECQQQFGYRLGLFQEIAPRAHYPLQRIQAEKYQIGNCILIGNAAHTLHPVAAQGLNLSLYEIKELSTFLKQQTENITLTSFQFNPSLQRYLQSFSHRLTQIFSTDLVGINFLRQLVLLGLDNSVLLKRQFMKKIMPA